MSILLAWPRSLLLLALTYVIFCSYVVQAKVDSLFTSSVTYCEPPEAILIQEFSIIYFAANQSVSFNISAASVEPGLKVRANIFLNVYGMQPVNITEDFCDLFGNALCPLPTYNFTGSSSLALPSSINVASKLPSIAYKIPDLEAFAQLTLTDINTGNVAACIQATLSNGWTTHQPAVSFSTGGFAIFALFSALLHSLLPSTPLAPSSFHNLPSIAPTRFVDFVLLFQQISSSGLLHLNFPLVYRAFTLNFAWAFGLFSDSQPIQRAINRMRHLTGGNLADGVQSPTAFVNRQLSPYNVPLPSGTSPSSFLSLVNAAFLAANRTIVARDSTTDSSAGNGPPATVTAGQQDILPAGIPVYVNSLNIGTANAFMSVFFTVLIGAVVGVGVLGIMYATLSFAVTRLKGNKWAWTDVMHAELRWFAISNGIRYAMVILNPVLIFAFFQWTLHDSWLSIFISVITLLCMAAAILYPAVQTLLISRRACPQVLYTTPSFARTFGALYNSFRMQRYHFFITLLVAAVVKSLFISFGKGSGLTQVIALLIIEIAVLVLLCIQKPHLSRGGDVLSIYLAITRVVAAILMFPFVESLQVKAIPRVAVGFVLIAVFSIAVVVMCVNVVLNFAAGLVWRRDASKPLGSSGGSSTDIEKGASIPAISTTLRPGNPTPTTSFSQEPSTHSRHTPQMSAAVSPNFTIPSFYTSEDEGEDGGMDESRSPRSPRHSHRRSQRSSFFTASSPPLTSRDEPFPSPPAHKESLQGQQQQATDTPIMAH
ncbi:TRP-domain-containing protein [Ramaria rubella]|nr:TRP-domain-containing protein [Ramaria rubella]